MAAPNPVTADADGKTIDATPQAGQKVSHGGNIYTTIKEGLAHILVPQGIPTSTDPKQLSKEDTQRQQVFYNPIQQFNRDLSVLAIKTFGQDLTHRRIAKHEQWKAKAERRKQRIQTERITGEEATTNGATTNQVNTNETTADDTPHAEEGTSHKRKLGDDAADDGAAPPKKQRVTENIGMDQTGSVDSKNPGTSETNGERTTWTPPFTILDALSATGLRAIRYAHEIPFATAITSNDMSHKAVESIKLNVEHNKVQDKVTVNTGNAIAYMYSYCDKKGYDAIDLDPYGTAAPFIDAALQAINDEGMLLVTCTDSAIFASHGYLEKTYSQYGGLPLKGEPCHEGGLRLILHAIASSAARYGMAIEPLLSLSIDYYARIFVRVRKAPIDVKLLAGKTMVVYHCESGCGAWTTQFLARNKVVKNKKGSIIYKHGYARGPSADQHCQHCGFKTHLVGPMYGGPLHNVGFIERVLAQLNEASRETYPTMDRIQGMLHTAMEEITYGTNKPAKSNGAQKTEVLDPLIPKMDPAAIEHHPFFLIPSSVAKVLHVSSPPAAALRGALRHAGFRVTMSHCKPGSIKTDASWKDIWHIMLEWARQRAPLKNALRKDTPGYVIMSKASATGHTQAPRCEAAAEGAANAPPSGARSDVEGIEGAALPGEDAPAYLDVKFKVDFDEELGRDHDRGKYVRYQLAPRENWGPMSRAK